MKQTILTIFFMCCTASFSDDSRQNMEQNGKVNSSDCFVKAPNNRMVSLNLDQPTVIKIAEAILVQIYGEKVLKQRPWKIIENDESFKIEGVMLPKIRGGVAEIVIRKSDGKVISYSHGK